MVMRLTVEEIAAAVGGHLVGPANGVVVDGATIDSRSVRGGELFVPVVAERDGHDFVRDALDAGAAAYLTGREPVGGTAVVVADTGLALLDLGRHARRRLTDMVVGITGSVGKTTVKDFTAAVLGARGAVAASERSFNNELGVPLTLVNAKDDVDAVVVEMGARGRGHVALLSDVARPAIGVVTAVALAHTEFFGSVEDVADAKAELIEALPARGTAVLNADQPLVVAMAERTRAGVVRFSPDGRAAGADVWAEGVSVDDDLRASFVLHSPWGTVEVRLGLRGAHQVGNALAAAGAAGAAGASLAHIAEGLARAAGSAWRMELSTAPSGARILNDAYNANPASASAALRALARLPAARRVAVLGVMAELGATSADEHAAVARLARELDIEVIAVGTRDYGVDPVDGVAAAERALGALGPGDAVLVKGSRVAGLEALAARLLQPAGEGATAG
jgi:UDP-N-acetylmuramoyl-tripeptide--D-alanyl-D-alanine ligase